MARKKDLKAAAARGADIFFTGTTEAMQDTDAMQEHEASEDIEVCKDTMIYDVIEASDDDAPRKAAEARQTQGRKGCKLSRTLITLTPSGMEYLKTMAALTGKSVTRYISDLVDRDAEKNKAIYEQAKELRKNARG